MRISKANDSETIFDDANVYFVVGLMIEKSTIINRLNRIDRLN